MFMQEIGWFSFPSILVYVYSALSLLVAGICWYVRHKIVPEYEDILYGELPRAAALLEEAHIQVRQINRQVDRGMDQIEALFNLIQGLFLSLIETKLVAFILKRINKAPLPVKVVAKKGLGQAFAVVHERVKHKKINQDEAVS